ncbi:glycosyltransferase [Segetibacter sp. 3557_3]|uniref:glycosyltransferase n=1 Tax=Segetibacter sp. 3557_3 TaxID=2547429 RepID=UPI0010588C88|nr:glycosyltransferase [Segetibacter sp. 3557_3]TDH20834.1 glycosyltransferase [Segetibacter sp. 3557_3]
MLNIGHFQFTLVSTVFNESKRLKQTIADLNSQTLQPAEIIITDAGSTDGTFEILEEWKRSSLIPIHIILKPKCNVAEGRNLAIRAASYDLIASTDFGCRFHKDWLRSLITPFRDPDVDVVGGSFTVIESDISTKAAKAAYIMSNGYSIDVNAPWFIPSSRSIAYKREVFTAIGGYCEWLTLAADDLVFGKELKAHGYRIQIVDEPFVYWGRHQKGIGYIKEAQRYGLGDGEARVNSRNFLKNSIELILRYLFFTLFTTFLVLSIAGKLDLIYFLLLLPLAAGMRSYISYTSCWLRFRSKKYDFPTYVYGFYLLDATRFSYIKGYLTGYLYSSDLQKEEAKALKKRLASPAANIRSLEPA